MMGVTERARQELERILLDNVDNPEAGLRLTARESGRLGLAIDVERPGDQVVEHDGSKVLLVEESLAASLNGLTLDVEATSEGPKLTITRES